MRNQKKDLPLATTEQAPINTQQTGDPVDNGGSDHPASESGVTTVSIVDRHIRLKYACLSSLLYGAIAMELLYGSFAAYSANEGFAAIDRNLLKGLLQKNLPLTGEVLASTTALLDFLVNTLAVPPRTTAQKLLGVDENLKRSSSNSQLSTNNNYATPHPALTLVARTCTLANFLTGALAPMLGVYFFLPRVFPSLNDNSTLLNTISGSLLVPAYGVGIAYYYSLSWEDAVNGLAQLTDKQKGYIRSLWRLDKGKLAEGLVNGFVFQSLLRGAAFAFMLEGSVGLTYYLCKTDGVNPLAFFDPQKSNPYPLPSSVIWALRFAGFAPGAVTAILTRGSAAFKSMLAAHPDEGNGQLNDGAPALGNADARQLSFKAKMTPMIYAGIRGGFPAIAAYTLLIDLLPRSLGANSGGISCLISLALFSMIAIPTYQVQHRQAADKKQCASVENNQSNNSVNARDAIATVLNIGSQTNRFFAGVKFLTSSILAPSLTALLGGLLSEGQINFVATCLAVMMTIELQIGNGIYMQDKIKNGLGIAQNSIMSWCRHDDAEADDQEQQGLLANSQ